jgi:5-(carboxyamino)imidazole ribonucleotide synthase
MQRSRELLQSAQAARHSDGVDCTLTGSRQIRLLRRSRTGASSACSAAASSCSRRRLPVIVTGTLRRVTTGRSFTIGIVGGGQLARMMHAASIGLGVNVRLLAEAPDSSAAQVVHDVTVGDYTDPATVRAFAADCDVVTFDHEHVPTGLLRELESDGVAVRPGPAALVHAQDKAIMRERLTALGAPCPISRVVSDAAALAAFGDEQGWPIVAKTSRGGYDGKGVWRLDAANDAGEPFTQLSDGVQIIAEEFVDFARELSALVVRSPSGQAAAYPISESVQRNGICVETITPAPELDDDHAVAAQQLALEIAHELDVVGVLAVELMQRVDGSVVVNELAMRPHNTGHWTIDGAVTSQFENHLRAVLDLPLGDPSSTQAWTVMANVFGGKVDDLPSALLHCFARDPRLRVQLYGKQVRPGRKVGHVTTLGDDLVQTRDRARHAAAYLMGDPNA